MNNAIEDNSIESLSVRQKEMIAAIRLNDLPKLKAVLNELSPSEFDFSDRQVTPLGIAYEADSVEAVKILLDKGFSSFDMGAIRTKYMDALFEYKMKSLLLQNVDWNSLPEFPKYGFSGSGALIFDYQNKAINSLRVQLKSENISQAVAMALAKRIDLNILEFILIIDSHKKWYLEGEGQNSWKFPKGYSVRDENTLKFLKALKISNSNGRHIQFLFQLECMTLYKFYFEDLTYFKYLYHHPNLQTKMIDIANTGLSISIDYMFQLAKAERDYYRERDKIVESGTDAGVEVFLSEIGAKRNEYSFLYVRGKELKSFPRYQVQLGVNHDDQIYRIVEDYFRYTFFNFDLTNGFSYEFFDLNFDKNFDQVMEDFFERTDLKPQLECDRKLDSGIEGCVETTLSVEPSPSPSPSPASTVIPVYDDLPGVE